MSAINTPKRTKTDAKLRKCKKRSTLLELPNEILFQITSYFSIKEIFWSLGFSCNRMNAISLDLVNIIDLCVEDIEHARQLYRKLILRKAIMSAIKHIWICSYPEIARQRVAAMFKNCKDKTLIFDYRLFDNRSSKHIGQNCTNLESLLLPSEYRYMARLTNRSIRNVISSCKKLNWINLRKCIEFDYVSSRNILSLISENCNDLQCIILSWLEFEEPVIERLFRYCNDLKVVIMNGCLSLLDESLIVMANNCPLLEFISVDNCINVSDKSITVIAHQCPYIDKLSLRNTNITYKSIKAIAFYCSELTVLNVQDCYVNTYSLKFLARQCRKLEKLDLTGIKATISSETIRMIASNSPSLKCLHLGFRNITHIMAREVEKRLDVLKWSTDTHSTTAKCLICFPVVKELRLIAEEAGVTSEKLCIENFIVNESNSVTHCWSHN